MTFGREVVDAWYPELEKKIIDEDENGYHVEATTGNYTFRYWQNKDGSPTFPFDPTNFIDKLYGDKYCNLDDDFNEMKDEGL